MRRGIRFSTGGGFKSLRASKVSSLMAPVLVTLMVGMLASACETTAVDHDLGVALVNHTRRSVGVRPVESNLHLSIGADRRAQALRDRWVAAGCDDKALVSFVDEVAWYTPSKAIKRWRLIGENVTSAQVVNGDRFDGVHRAFRVNLGTPENYARIVNRQFSLVGMAVVYGPTPAQSEAGACPWLPAGSVAVMVQVFLG